MNMKSLKSFFGSGFGKLDASNGVALTFQGLGVRSKDGQFNIFDKGTKTISAVPAEMVLGEFPAYAFPTNKLEVGDLVIHNGDLKYVSAVPAAAVDGAPADTEFEMVNIKTQVVEKVIPAKTMLGYVVASKVFTPFGNIGSGGNVFAGGAAGGAAFNPQMLMAMAVMSDGDIAGGDDDGMMMAMMMGGFGGGAADAANPMGSMLPILMMSKMFK